jgi:hypothetical protein
MSIRRFSNENFSDKKKKVESKEVISGTIVSNSSSALQLQGTAAQTGNLLEVKNSGNNEVTSISNTGIVKANIFQDTEDLLSEAVLWLDAAYSGGGQTIRNLGYGGRQLDARNGSTTGQDSNDAQYLDWDGINYVYLPGVVGNYLSVPDEAALDITGDIDLQAHIKMDNYQTGTPTLVSKWTDSGNQRGYFMRLNSGSLQLFFSTDGADFPSASSSVVVPATNDIPIWVRATLDVDNDAGGKDFKFFTSSDGVTWTQFGSTVTQAGTASIFSNTANVNIGAYNNGATNLSTASIYAARIFDGIEENSGTKVLDIDTSKITSGSNTSFNALTGQVVTINRSTSGRKSVAVVSPIWLFGTDDYMEVANDALINFGSADSFTVLAVVRQWDTPNNFGRYVEKRAASIAGYAITSSGTSLQMRAAITGGGNESGRSGSSFTGGTLIRFAGVFDRTAQTVEPFVNGVSNGTTSIATVDSPTNTLPLRVGRRSDGGAYQDFELLAVAVFRRALTQSEINAISQYYQARLS